MYPVVIPCVEEEIKKNEREGTGRYFCPFMAG
jgi:hypothetical protein